jgi:hypothetical protein
MSRGPVQPAWRYAAAGSVAAVIVFGATVWLGASRDRAVGTTEATSAAPPGSATAPAVETRAPASASSVAAEPAVPAVPPTSAEVHEMFLAAVRKAREAPRPPPPPGIARAKSFEEAFEAMRAAEPPPPAAPIDSAATQSPFGVRR